MTTLMVNGIRACFSEKTFRSKAFKKYLEDSGIKEVMWKEHKLSPQEEAENERLLQELIGNPKPNP